MSDVTLRPKMKPRHDFPNIGLQDFVDMMDHLGFSVEFKLVKKDATADTVDDIPIQSPVVP